jgi:hypothetical protein
MINGAVDNPAMRRFEIDLGDGVAAAYYRQEGDRLIFTHTEVPFEHSGQGIGGRLAEAVLEEVRARGAKAVLKCPFLSYFVARHPQYRDLVAG